MRRILVIVAVLGLSACAMVHTQSSYRPYDVFFTERSSALEPAAVDVVAQAAKSALGHGVTVLGYTDSVGSKPDDAVLSQQRARRVADALIADGVPAASITVAGRGQTGTDPGIESRRVEIHIGS